MAMISLPGESDWNARACTIAVTCGGHGAQLSTAALDGRSGSMRDAADRLSANARRHTAGELSDDLHVDGHEC